MKLNPIDGLKDMFRGPGSVSGFAALAGSTLFKGGEYVVGAAVRCHTPQEFLRGLTTPNVPNVPGVELDTNVPVPEEHADSLRQAS